MTQTGNGKELFRANLSNGLLTWQFVLAKARRLEAPFIVVADEWTPAPCFGHTQDFEEARVAHIIQVAESDNLEAVFKAAQEVVGNGTNVRVYTSDGEEIEASLLDPVPQVA